MFSAADKGKAVHDKEFGMGVIEFVTDGKPNILFTVLFNGDKWDDTRTYQTYNQHGKRLDRASRLWEKKQTLFIK